MARMRQHLPWYAAQQPRGPVPINPAMADLTGLCFAYGAHNSERPRDAVSGAFASSTNLISLSHHQSNAVGLRMVGTVSHATWPVGSGANAARRLVAAGYRFALWWGVSFGAVTGTDVEFANLSASDTQNDAVISIGESSGNLAWTWRNSSTFLNRNSDVGLSTNRNRPISLFAEVRAGATVLNRGGLIGIGQGPVNIVSGSPSFTDISFSTSGNERAILGPDVPEQGGSRTPNWITFGAAFFGGQPMSDALITELGRKPYALWLPYERRSFMEIGAPAPAISVSGNGNAISDGDATPDAADHTDFGSIVEGGATVSRTFTVANPGGATLNISSVTVPTGFTKTTDLPATIAAAANAGLVVRLDNSVVGVKSGDITIAHDAVGSPFNFAITGEVTAAPPPPPPPPPSSGIPQAPASGATFAPAGLLIR